MRCGACAGCPGATRASAPSWGLTWPSSGARSGRRTGWPPRVRASTGCRLRRPPAAQPPWQRRRQRQWRRPRPRPPPSPRGGAVGGRAPLRGTTRRPRVAVAGCVRAWENCCAWTVCTSVRFVAGEICCCRCDRLHHLLLPCTLPTAGRSFFPRWIAEFWPPPRQQATPHVPTLDVRIGVLCPTCFTFH